MFGRSGLYCFCFCLCYITYFLIFLAFFIFWLIFLPQEPKFTITNASLTQFNLTNTSINNNTIHYNLTVLPKPFSNFNSETTNGVYSIDVKISFRIGIRFGKVKTGYFKIPRKSDCKLKVPLSTSFNGTLWSGFQTTECKSFRIFGDPDASPA